MSYFKWFANGDRLTRQRLTDMMSKRYPLGTTDEAGEYHPSLCDAMVRQLWICLDQSGADIKFD